MIGYSIAFLIGVILGHFLFAWIIVKINWDAPDRFDSIIKKLRDKLNSFNN